MVVTLGRQYNVGDKSSVILYTCCLKKNQNEPRPSEHPPVRGGEYVKTFRWDDRLQIIQKLFMTFKGVALW